MRSTGFTLIELLIVISIIALLAVVGFVSFKDFAANQVIVKAAGEVQTLFRLAQTNATTYTLCNNGITLDQGAVSWSLYFYLSYLNRPTIDLRCDDAAGHTDYVVKTYYLTNAQLSIKGSNCSSEVVPVTFKYLAGVGTLTIIPSDVCMDNSNSVVFTVSKPTGSSSNASPQSFTVSKGGAINQ